MNSNTYFEKSRNIARKLNSQFSLFCDNHPEYDGIRDTYLSKKVHFNGMQFVSGFEAGESDKDIISYLLVPILLEHIMLAAYKKNYILDEKKEVWQNKETVKKMLIQECSINSLIGDLETEVWEKTNAEEELFLRKLIPKMQSHMNKGFMIEHNELCTHTKPLKTILQNWDTNYEKRNVSFNLLYDYTPLVGVALSQEKYDIIDQYETQMTNTSRFSYTAQLLNDYSDFGENVDSNVKVAGDKYADLRAGVITSPIHYLRKTKSIQLALCEPGITFHQDWRRQMRREVEQSGLRDFVQDKCQESYNQNITFLKEQSIWSEELAATYALLTKSKYLS